MWVDWVLGGPSGRAPGRPRPRHRVRLFLPSRLVRSKAQNSNFEAVSEAISVFIFSLVGRKSITKNSRFFDFFGVEAIFQCKNQFFNGKIAFLLNLLHIFLNFWIAEWVADYGMQDC